MILLFAPAKAGAVDPSAGTGGAAFLKLGLGSARAMALGRAYAALAEGSEALTWNPAGLALTQTREASYSFMRHVQGMDAPLFMSYAHPLGRTVLGANLAYLSVEGFDVRDSAGRQLNSSDAVVRQGFATMGLARSFWYEKLFAGVSLKGVHEDLAGVRRGSMVGDFGAIFRPNAAASFAFASQNFGGSADRVGKITRLGAALRAFELLQIGLEFSKPSDNDWRLGLGGEMTLPEELLSVGQAALRMGYYTTGDQGTILKSRRPMLYPLVGTQGLSFGIGLFSSQAFGYGVGFDYTIVPLGALGVSDQLSLKVRF